MTTSAARKLVNAITAYGDYVSISYDNLEWEYSNLEALLTAALKRCRNEALEEVSHNVHSALFDLTMANKTACPADICSAATSAITNLKEAE